MSQTKASYPTNRERYRKAQREQDVTVTQIGFASYPDRWSTSKARGEELRGEWAEATQKWLDAADNEDAEAWAYTFAPEHPEWFA